MQKPIYPFYQYEISVIKAAEKQTKYCDIFNHTLLM